MNLREQTINDAVGNFASVQTDIVAAIRAVAVDIALAAEGMPRLTAEERQEVDAAVSRSELPYGERAGCRRCVD